MIIVDILCGTGHRHPSLFIKKGCTRIRLQIGMVNPGRLIGLLDDDFSLFESFLDIALDDVKFYEQVPVFMNQGSMGFERLLRMVHEGKIFVEDDNLLCRFFCGFNSFCCNERHRITDIPHPVPCQNRLILGNRPD